MDFLDSFANELTEGAHLDEIYFKFSRALGTR